MTLEWAFKLPLCHECQFHVTLKFSQLKFSHITHAEIHTYVQTFIHTYIDVFISWEYLTFYLLYIQALFDQVHNKKFYETDPEMWDTVNNVGLR